MTPSELPRLLGSFCLCARQGALAFCRNAGGRRQVQEAGAGGRCRRQVQEAGAGGRCRRQVLLLPTASCPCLLLFTACELVDRACFCDRGLPCPQRSVEGSSCFRTWLYPQHRSRWRAHLRARAPAVPNDHAMTQSLTSWQEQNPRLSNHHRSQHTYCWISARWKREANG
jgi:hypothetical protein